MGEVVCPVDVQSLAAQAVVVMVEAKALVATAMEVVHWKQLLCMRCAGSDDCGCGAPEATAVDANTHKGG